MAPVPSGKRGRAARLVLTAIKRLDCKNGATLKHISEYLRVKYPQCQSNQTDLKKVVENAVEFGALKKIRNKYMLGTILDHIVQKRKTKSRTEKRGISCTERKTGKKVAKGIGRKKLRRNI